MPLTLTDPSGYEPKGGSEDPTAQLKGADGSPTQPKCENAGEAGDCIRAITVPSRQAASDIPNPVHDTGPAGGVWGGQPAGGVREPAGLPSHVRAQFLAAHISARAMVDSVRGVRNQGCTSGVCAAVKDAVKPGLDRTRPMTPQEDAEITREITEGERRQMAEGYAALLGHVITARSGASTVLMVIEVGTGVAEPPNPMTMGPTSPAGVAPLKDAPPPNFGKSPPHGNPVHDAYIRRIAKSMRAKGWQDVRVNQRQANAQIKTVGRNQPDVSGIYPKHNRRVNIEVDRTRAGSARHQNTVPGNDPNAVHTFIRIDAQGRPIAATTIKP